MGRIRTGTIEVSGGKLILTTGPAETYYNPMRVTGGTVAGSFTLYSNDRRSSPWIGNGATLAPGIGVGTITVDWGTAGGVPAPGPGNYSLVFTNGSIYAWEVGTNATDTIHLIEGRLYIYNMILKILDAGGAPKGTNRLPVFTYAAGVERYLLGTVTFDTSALDPKKWDTRSVTLADDGAGTIYVTGLSRSGATGTLIAIW